MEGLSLHLIMFIYYRIENLAYIEVKIHITKGNCNGKEIDTSN